jgi:hypothetical protein
MDTLAMADEAVASRRRRVLLPFVHSERLASLHRDASFQGNAKVAAIDTGAAIAPLRAWRPAVSEYGRARRAGDAADV